MSAKLSWGFLCCLLSFFMVSELSLLNISQNFSEMYRIVDSEFGRLSDCLWDMWGGDDWLYFVSFHNNLLFYWIFAQIFPDFSKKNLHFQCTGLGENLEVPRVVLSSASEYLRSLLHSHPGSHPVIIKHHVDFHVLNCIVQFMYR